MRNIIIINYYFYYFLVALIIFCRLQLALELIKQVWQEPDEANKVTPVNCGSAFSVNQDRVQSAVCCHYCLPVFNIGITLLRLSFLPRIKEGEKNKKVMLISREINFLFQTNCVESKRVPRPPGEQTAITNGPWTEGFYLTLDFRLLTLSTHS